MPREAGVGVGRLEAPALLQPPAHAGNEEDAEQRDDIDQAPAPDAEIGEGQ